MKRYPKYRIRLERSFLDLKSEPCFVVEVKVKFIDIYCQCGDMFRTRKEAEEYIEKLKERTNK